MLDEKTKELIAVGAAITANCHPCLKHHVALARSLGTPDGEIAAAIAVGKQVRKGAAGETEKVACALFTEQAPARAGCGCS